MCSNRRLGLTVSFSKGVSLALASDEQSISDSIGFGYVRLSAFSCNCASDELALPSSDEHCVKSIAIIRMKSVFKKFKPFSVLVRLKS